MIERRKKWLQVARQQMYLKRIESILQVPNIDEKPCIAQLNFAEETMEAIYLEFNFTCTALVNVKMKPTETAEYCLNSGIWQW